LGAVKPSEEFPRGDPNVDYYARSSERPIRRVTIKPFFLSKYEMTQAQWVRMTGHNPSKYHPGFDKDAGFEYTLLHPVEGVCWQDCVEALFRYRLRLPSEAEWEYAARANTTTPWWTGTDRKSLKGAVNLSDKCCKETLKDPNSFCELWLDDGYCRHAPPGMYAANAFGLHDVCGNVWEWCQDRFGSYKKAPVDGSASDVDAAFNRQRVYRGGSWLSSVNMCRSAYRDMLIQGGSFFDLGLRPALSLRD